MNLSPFLAQDRELAGQLVLDPAHLASTESIALSQFWWSARTMEDERRFAFRSYYVNMPRSMISGVNNPTQAFETKYGWHPSINLSA
jgi:hypothetical protein